MKRVFRYASLAAVILALVVWLCNPIPATAGDDMGTGSIPIEEIYSTLGVPFDPEQGGCPDPNDFEFLLELESEDVNNPPDGLPAYKKVTGKLFPEIRFELRLPLGNGWN